MEPAQLQVLKDVVTIIAYVVAVIGGLYTFFKWIWPKTAPFFLGQIYLNNSGVHVIKDIEKHFGKEAGRVLKEIIKQKGMDILVDEMRLNIIENAIGLGIFICDVEGKCTYANKTLSKMFGLSQSEMLVHGWLAPIVDKQTAFLNWKFSVDHNTPYRDTYEVVLNGEKVKYSSEAEPSLTDDDTVILGYVGIVKKID